MCRRSGYDPHPDPKIRGLIVNAEEAETVCTIFALYDDLGCLNAVMRRANTLGLRSKRHRFKSGRIQGGNRFSRGQIYAALRNPIYIGNIRHKTRVWDGQHEPIISEAVWERVQAKLQAASTRPRSRVASSSNRMGPLTGKLRDETGDRLTPTHTWRHGRQIRYKKQSIVLGLNTDGLVEALEIQPNEMDRAVLTIEAPFELRRCGVEGKIVIGDREAQPDRTLVRALSRAHVWAPDLRNGTPLGEIAAATRHAESYIRTRSQSFLSHQLQGRSSKEVNRRT